MAITTGSKLGPYDLQGELGAGGMGEVYRGRDTRLGRDVAIKVLPPAFSADDVRLRRFEQEARALGALNHPNLLAVHDVGTQDGAPFIVSELLEGTTLRERLASGALPVRKAVDYALQIARGLAAAHDKGIIHRDLKPENIFVTRDGRVKVLDFGLAKLVELSPEDATRTVQSDAGTVLGTVGYMSPEQVRGKPLDARSDLFSFGAVLYEMLSGRRAFHGESSVETMSAILKEEPPDLSTTGRNAPLGLQRIVEHCLEKNPQERFQSAHDIAFDLENLTTSSATATAQAAVAEVKRGRMRTAALATVALLAVLIAGVLVGRKTVPTAVVPTYHQLTFRRGTVRSAQFVGNGQVVYSAAWEGDSPELFVASLDRRASNATGIRNADVEAVSRQGEVLLIADRQVVYANVQPGTLARMPLSGAAPRALLQDVQSADWGPDGSSIAVARYVVGQRFRLEYPIGKLLYETDGWVSSPRVSPNGDMVAFLEHPMFGDDMGWVAVIDAAGHKRVLSPQFASIQTLLWTPTGNELWFSASRSGVNSDVYGVTLAGKMRAVGRAPGGLRVFDLAPDGRAIVAQGHMQFSAFGLGARQKEERDLTVAEWSIPIAISNDGTTLLVDEEAATTTGAYSAYLRKMDGSPPVNLGEGQALALSPDGQSVMAVTVSTPGQLLLFPTGAGEAKALTHDEIDHRTASWLPDSKHFVFLGAEPGKRPRIYEQGIDDGARRAIAPEGITGSVACSPDGKKVAVSGEHTWIVPLDGGDVHVVPGISRAKSVTAWSADGHSLYVFQKLSHPAKLYRVDPITGKSEIVRQFAPADMAGVRSVGPVVVTPDAKAYAYGVARDLNELYSVDGMK